jgi:hypothetical protein
MLFITRLMETSMTLDEYFHSLYEEPLIDGYPMWSGLPINKQEKQDMSAFDMWDKDEEPLTKIYFSITTPAVDQYPEHTHTLDINWQDGARWYDVLWEVMSVLEASYGYSIKEKVFFKMHELNIQAEEWHGNPDLAKQMFTKELS